ncbi:WXG100 family type VII secretion target [Saccharothrix sp. MB29]|nr:WXG100 family type VII secretion target [Saccharothrix sp. MB29]
MGAELDYLSGISRRLGVRDLVADYFAPVLGDWDDLHDEAGRWRRAGLVAEHVTRDLTGPLGKLDSAWQGRDADAFVDHMRQVGLAGHDMSDAMHAMGEALDGTAEGVRGIVEDMSRVFAEAAEAVSGAAALPLDGDRRVVEVLDDLHDPVKELHESVRDVLEAFLRLCDGVSGSDDFADVAMEHRYPERDWTWAEPAKPPTRPPTATRRPRATAPPTGRPGAPEPPRPPVAAVPDQWWRRGVPGVVAVVPVAFPAVAVAFPVGARNRCRRAAPPRSRAGTRGTGGGPPAAAAGGPAGPVADRRRGGGAA